MANLAAQMFWVRYVRRREGEKQCMYTHIYIYRHMHICVHIYIYIRKGGRKKCMYTNDDYAALLP